MTISEQVRQTASDIFNVPVEQITPESTPETLENWDSIQHLNLVLAMEERFSLQLSPEDIEQMQSIADIIRIAEQKLGHK